MMMEIVWNHTTKSRNSRIILELLSPGLSRCPTASISQKYFNDNGAFQTRIILSRRLCTDSRDTELPTSSF
ncbi:hypothetical protein WN48_02356 [Eufriesea mexicana]|nr:hypothetical protein WN48_02356 [Eufriesea mexicana]